MAHLLGDPVDTIRNLLRKLATCQRRAKKWKSAEPLDLKAIQIDEENEQSSNNSSEVDGQDTQGNEDNPMTETSGGTGDTR